MPPLIGAVVVPEAPVVVVEPDMPALDGVRGGSGSCKRREVEVGVSSMKTPESDESDMYKSALYTSFTLSLSVGNENDSVETLRVVGLITCNDTTSAVSPILLLMDHRRTRGDSELPMTDGSS
jgi:hypothetical protein